MTSNSRPATRNTSFPAAPRPTKRVSESYSENLMDDLFGDVDRILDGDLSDCMTFVSKQKKPASQNTRTVQLPSDFSSRSAAEIYQATMAASNTSQPTGANSRQVVSPSIYHQPSAQQRTLSASATGKSAGYRNGGRPVTSFRASAAQSGNFRSAVIQTPNGFGTTTVDVHTSPASVDSSYIYGQQPLNGTANHVGYQTASPRPPQTIFEPKASTQPVSLPFLLMGAAGISVASTVGLWAMGNSAPNGGWLLSFNTEATAAELPANSEEEFLVYLQKSLETISAAQTPPNQTVAVVPVATASTLPTVVPGVNEAPAVGALPNLPGGQATPNVIERVFVPVYEGQSANAQVAVAATNAAVPNVATPSAAARPTVPVPAPVAAAAALPPGAPASATTSVPIVPGSNSTLPSLPTSNPTVNTAVAPTNAAVGALTDITPDSEQVLVGVLNLGSRSAALFDVDGSSQRAYVGDRIGTSEWSLVSVNGQDVVIRRDGEVRSVYIGQRF
ncbi:MAG: hypothetical protein AAFR25_08650 [Cyanobacteria bacterium J06629_19]